ncbi:hypothetical protein, partial [Candidatus Ruminimicrobium bovinum]|uniref:hypothetical protein n=1 Tax=Candidatus Ruminimicrobium bovinum TaxID=3242779 RepID=UPI0039B83AE2
ICRVCSNNKQLSVAEETFVSELDKCYSKYVADFKKLGFEKKQIKGIKMIVNADSELANNNNYKYEDDDININIVEDDVINSETFKEKPKGCIYIIKNKDIVISESNKLVEMGNVNLKFIEKRKKGDYFNLIGWYYSDDKSIKYNKSLKDFMEKMNREDFLNIVDEVIPIDDSSMIQKFILGTLMENFIVTSKITNVNELCGKLTEENINQYFSKEAFKKVFMKIIETDRSLLDSFFCFNKECVLEQSNNDQYKLKFVNSELELDLTKEDAETIKNKFSGVIEMNINAYEQQYSGEDGNSAICAWLLSRDKINDIEIELDCKFGFDLRLDEYIQIWRYKIFQQFVKCELHKNINVNGKKGFSEEVVKQLDLEKRALLEEIKKNEDISHLMSIGNAVEEEDYFRTYFELSYEDNDENSDINPYRRIVGIKKVAPEPHEESALNIGKIRKCLKIEDFKYLFMLDTTRPIFVFDINNKKALIHYINKDDGYYKCVAAEYDGELLKLDEKDIEEDNKIREIIKNKKMLVIGFVKDTSRKYYNAFKLKPNCSVSKAVSVENNKIIIKNELYMKNIYLDLEEGCMVYDNRIGVFYNKNSDFLEKFIKENDIDTKEFFIRVALNKAVLDFVNEQEQEQEQELSDNNKEKLKELFFSSLFSIIKKRDTYSFINKFMEVKFFYNEDNKIFTYNKYFFKSTNQPGLDARLLKNEYDFYNKVKENNDIKNNINKVYGYFEKKFSDKEQWRFVVSKNLKEENGDGFDSLWNFIKNNKSELTSEERINIIKEVLKIQNKLEKQGLYNYDLKPENVMIKRKEGNKDDFEIKLIDYEGVVPKDSTTVISTYVLKNGGYFLADNTLRTAYYNYIKFAFMLDVFSLDSDDPMNYLNELRLCIDNIYTSCKNSDKKQLFIAEKKFVSTLDKCYSDSKYTEYFNKLGFEEKQIKSIKMIVNADSELVNNNSYKYDDDININIVEMNDVINSETFKEKPKGCIYIIKNKDIV